MNISPQQAADALRDIELTESHSRQLHQYQSGSSILFLWGVIWMIGYGVTGYSHKALIWIPLSVIGMLATFMLSRKFRHHYTPADWKVRGRKFGLSWVVIFAFISSVYAVMQPHNPNVFAAFPALMVAFSYGIAGALFLPRYLWLGIAVFALTLTGFFYVADGYNYWMAVVGGGALMLGGLWLRKA